MKIIASLCLLLCTNIAFSGALIHKDEANKTITIQSRLMFYGEELTPKSLEDLGESVSLEWNNADQLIRVNNNTYRLHFDVEHTSLSAFEARFIALSNKNPRDILIKLSPKNRMNTSYAIQGKGIINLQTSGDYIATKVLAHEYGHTLGLSHHSDSVCAQETSTHPLMCVGMYFVGSDETDESRAYKVSRVLSKEDINALSLLLSGLKYNNKGVAELGSGEKRFEKD